MISDTVWRDINAEYYLLEKYPDEEVLIYGNDAKLRSGRAKYIKREFFDWHFIDNDGYKVKVKKFCFIGGY
jgi:hypothetical protein